MTRFDRINEARRVIGQVDETVLAKAILKAERWMRKSFGEVSWSDLDTGSLVGAYSKRHRERLEEFP